MHRLRLFIHSSPFYFATLVLYNYGTIITMYFILFFKFFVTVHYISRRFYSLNLFEEVQDFIRANQTIVHILFLTSTIRLEPVDQYSDGFRTCYIKPIGLKNCRVFYAHPNTKEEVRRSKVRGAA
jgi:hypothetical protein